MLASTSTSVTRASITSISWDAYSESQCYMCGQDIGEQRRLHYCTAYIQYYMDNVITGMYIIVIYISTYVQLPRKLFKMGAKLNVSHCHGYC